MLSEEVLKKIRLIEFKTRKFVDTVMTGQFRSTFRGHGMQFSEHRVYTPGDDVRAIDWKVSARTREPMIKLFEEERELTILLIIDVSGSKTTGTQGQLKSEASAEMAALLAHAANITGDKMGLLLFSDHVEKILPPKRGRPQVFRILKEILDTPRLETRKTDIKSALQSASRLLKHSGIVFVISDFIDDGYELEIKRMAKKHDVTAIQILDPIEVNAEFPFPWIRAADPETGEEFDLKLDKKSFKKWFQTQHAPRLKQIEDISKKGGFDFFRVTSAEDYLETLVKYFQYRNKRRR